jgi:hypothetical protein
VEFLKFDAQKNERPECEPMHGGMQASRTADFSRIQNVDRQ